MRTHAVTILVVALAFGAVSGCLQRGGNDDDASTSAASDPDDRGDDADTATDDTAGTDDTADDGDRCAGLRRLDAWRISADDTLGDVDAIASCVETIDGALEVMETGLTSLEFPELVSVGRVEVWRNTQLMSLAFPKLVETVDPFEGIVAIEDNDALTTLDLSSLKCAPRDACGPDPIQPDPWYGNGGISVDGNDALRVLELPALEAVGDLRVAGGDSLERFAAPSLELVIGSLTSEAGDVFTMGLRFFHCYALTEVSVPNLAEIRFGALDVARADALVSLSASSLVSSRAILVSYNASLATLDFPALTDLAFLEVLSNSSLSVCAIADIEAQTGTTCEPIDAWGGPDCDGNLQETCD